MSATSVIKFVKKHEQWNWFHLPTRTSRLALRTTLSKPPQSTLHLTMTRHEFVRLASSERRTAREALLDAVLDKDFEPWAFAPCSSSTEDTLQAAEIHEAILLRSIRKLSLEFESDELSDILAASAAPPPPLRRSGSSPAMVASVRMTSVCPTFAEEEEPDNSEAHCGRGTLADLLNHGRPAPPSQEPEDDECASSAPLSLPASCVRDVSSISSWDSCKDMADVNAAASSYRQQRAMSFKVQGSFAGLDLSVGEDDTQELHDSSCLL